jgi:large subunit ribosomal protein L22
MRVKASAKWLRVSPQKARLVVDLIRGLPVGKACEQLDFCNKKSAPMVKNVLLSAIANAENNFSLDVDELFVKEIQVGQANVLNRFRARAKGRAGPIKKRLSHIFIELGEKGSK